MSLLSTVNESLPVCMTEDDVEKMPEFADLLLAMSKRITADGTGVSVQKEIDEAKEFLWCERYEWLQHKILLTEVRQILVELEMKALDGELSDCDQQFCEKLNLCLTISEMIPYLHSTSDSEVSILGLTADDLKRRHQNESITLRIRTEVENLMKRKCIAIAQFYVPGGKTNNDNLNCAKACQLPGLLETHLQELRQEQQQLEQNKKQYDLAQQKHHQQLKQCWTLLTKICKRKLKLLNDVKDISSSYLESYNKTLHSKLVLCNTEILADTYTEKTVPALRIIGHSLDNQLKKAKEVNRQVTQALKEYEKLGPEFTSDVDKYRKLEEEIESVKWSLDRLKKQS